ncbi:GTP-binding protein, partial [Salmonella enterica subsp. enterica serovar Kentucky]|nr:GTP-binding protein [Salmonella enterica subsp. enterica serovar Kentucky]
LLAPFPAAMIDTAFFDRFHAYIPGWEIPKMRPEFFTNRYGLMLFQGVQRLYSADWDRPWGDETPHSTLVFIGIQLPEDEIRAA